MQTHNTRFTTTVIEFSNPCPALNVFYQKEELVPYVNVQNRKLFPCKIGNVSEYPALSLICASNISSLYAVPKMKLYNPLHRIFEVTRYDVWICQTELVLACDGNTSDRNRRNGVCVQRYTG
jgi:hypothetical protein